MSPEGTTMNGANVGKVVLDLLSTPALINRIIRRKLLTATLAETEAELRFLHYDIMRVLKDEGTLHPSKIGEKLIIAKAHMTHLIDKLVEVGYVKREMGASDRRTFNITITDAGRRVLDEQDSMVINAVKEVMSELSEKELESLASSLRSLRDILNRLQ
jgi:DNA-binding MarR family transcriptional regulator